MQLILCDVDGCLTPEASVPFDIARLARLAAHDGPALTLCTGRPQPFAECLARLLGLDNWLVAENGAWLYHPTEHRYELDPAITPALLAAVQQLDAWLRARFATEGAQVQPGKTASVSLHHPDHQWLVHHRDAVAAEVAARGWPIRVSMTWFYINCDLEPVSKASGVRRLMRRTGLERHQLAGIGDTLGDLGIAEHVAWFACPANADPRLKERAHYVSPFPEAEGVLDILDHLPG